MQRVKEQSNKAGVANGTDNINEHEPVNSWSQQQGYNVQNASVASTQYAALSNYYGASYPYQAYGITDGNNTWTNGDAMTYIGSYNGQMPPEAYAVDGMFGGLANAFANPFGQNHGPNSAYGYFPSGADYSAWNAAKAPSYEDYYRDGVYNINQRLQRIDVSSEANQNKFSYADTAKNEIFANSGSSYEKKTTWASIASQPAKPVPPPSSVTGKKKGPGMPPPPVTPSKMDIGTWEGKANIPPKAPVVQAPPPIAKPVWPGPMQETAITFPMGSCVPGQTSRPNIPPVPGTMVSHPPLQLPQQQYQPHQVTKAPAPHLYSQFQLQQHQLQQQKQQQQQPLQQQPKQQQVQSKRQQSPPHQLLQSHVSATPQQRKQQEQLSSQHNQQHQSTNPQTTLEQTSSKHQSMHTVSPSQSQQKQRELTPPSTAPHSQESSVTELTEKQNLPHPPLEKILNKNNYNPVEFDVNAPGARFFVIKSYSEDDIHRSIKYEIWCSTEHGNKRLEEAYQERQKNNGMIYLFFSVNSSGHFCGMARMMSNVDYSSSSKVWEQDKWKGQFKVQWIYVKDVPNGKLRHIRLENNENKPVTNSRDVQEVPHSKGVEVLKIIHTYKNTTSIFDDFIHYEKRQEENVKKFVPPYNAPMAAPQQLQSMQPQHNTYPHRNTNSYQKEREPSNSFTNNGRNNGSNRPTRPYNSNSYSDDRSNGGYYKNSSLRS